MSLASIFQSVAGQESADLEDAVVATAEEAAEAVVEQEIAEAEKEIAEVSEDVAQAETAIDALEEKVEELEEQIDGLESMMSGSTPFNAGLFAHQFAHAAKISGKFGQPVEVQGAESFADASTANLNAFAGVESFKATAGKAVATVKKFFIELYNSFINLFVGLFNRLKGIKNKAVQVKARVNAAETVKAGDALTLAKSANMLETDGSSKAISSLVAVGGKVFSELQGLGKAHEDNSASAVHAVADAFAAAGSKSIDGKNDNTETLVVKIGQGATVKIVAPVKDAGLVSVNVTVSAGEAKATSSVKDKARLLAIVNGIASDADKLQNAKLDRSALTQQRDRAIGVLATDANANIKDSEGEARGAAKADKKNTTAAIKNAHRAGLKLARAATSLGGDILAAQLNFVEAHLGGKVKEAAKAA